MENMRSGSGNPPYRMPEGLRVELATPVGDIFTDISDIIETIRCSELIVTVGDVVTLDLLEAGLHPDISIVDFMTHRESRNDLRERFARFPQREVRVVNPQGCITRELWDAIRDSYANPGNVRIVVEGEEDLASIACIALAPDNTTVIYGIPNRGASVHHVDEPLRKLARDALDKMRTGS